MHQLGLMQIVRVALVFVAAALVATQFFSLVGASGASQAEASPAEEERVSNAWPTIALVQAVPLGAVFFDGAAPTGDLTTGALEPVRADRSLTTAAAPATAPASLTR
ncbi:MAG: hypothetical protein AAGE83_16420 [Pseudomonadota bacterium]